MTPSPSALRKVTGEMVSATDILIAASVLWQADNPDAVPMCFILAAAKYVAEHFAQVSDEAFERMLSTMRDVRQDRLRQKES